MSTVPHQSMQWKGIELKQCRVRWLGAAVWGIAAQLRLMVPYLSCYVHDWNVINLIKLAVECSKAHTRHHRPHLNSFIGQLYQLFSDCCEQSLNFISHSFSWYPRPSPPPPPPRTRLVTLLFLFLKLALCRL